VLDGCHEEDGIDVRREAAIVVGEEHLGLEVADRPQAADDECGADPVAEIDRQPVEGLDRDTARGDRRGGRGKRLVDDGDAFVGREERLLARIGEDARAMTSRWPFVIGSNEPG